MHFTLSRAVLLTSLLVVLLSNGAEAAPTTRHARMVTLPLQPVTQKRDDIHPFLYHQLHINRAQKRMALMTGRDQPSDQELAIKMHKRAVDAVHHEKRFNRAGTKQVRGIAKDLGIDDLLSAVKSGGATVNGAVAQTDNGVTDGGVNHATAAAAQQVGGTAAAVAVNTGDLTIAQPPKTINTLGLNIEANDVGYMATVQMGTPARNFLILMDSGSADLWVGSEKCAGQAGGNCGKHQFLGPQSSQSFVASQQPFKITYGTGSVSGTLAKDTISFAGLSLPEHTLGVANVESQEFSTADTPFDGLMGLARSTLSQQKVPTPIEALATAGQVDAAVTSYKISRAADKKNDGGITFGGLDPTKFDPNTLVTIDNVNKQGFFEAPLGGITVNGKTIAIPAGSTSVLDTGTTLIVAPPADAIAIHKQIPGSKAMDAQGSFSIPCDSQAVVAFQFQGQTFNIDPRDLAFAPIQGTNDCISGISGGQFAGPKAYLSGDVLLKNAYFSTDATNNKLSLAQLT